MATARVNKEVTRVTLQLSADEADALSAVLAGIGGDPHYSPRKHIGSVFDALDDAGFRYDKSKAHKLLKGNMFSNYGVTL